MFPSISHRFRFAVSLLITSLVLAESAQAQCLSPDAQDGVVRRESGSLAYTLFLPAGSRVDPVPVARRLFQQHMPGAAWHTAFPDAGQKSDKAWATAKRLQGAAQVNAPAVDYLDLKGRGLTAEQKTAIAGAVDAVEIYVHLPERSFAADFAAAHQAVLKSAQELRAAVHDVDTRETFWPDALQARRMGAETNRFDVVKHITISMYRNGEHFRAVTLGMRKFGLPELAIGALSSTESGPAGHLMNLIAQRMVEAPLQARKGRIVVRVADMSDPALRKLAQEKLEKGGSGVADVCLVRRKPEEGDAENRLLQIEFDTVQGVDQHARRHKVLWAMQGGEPSGVREARAGDAELAAASARAKAEMPRLRARFNKGLAFKEELMVKATFRRTDGSAEFMWIEVSRWKAGQIQGLLLSTPRYVTGVRAGQQVTLPESDFYDYILKRADGSMEGNETGKILEQRAGK
jgi:uncharacterized protein YegJ (DUF2314 family)